MSQILELAHFTQRNGMSEVQIRTCWIDAKLDGKGFSLCKFLFQSLKRDNLHGT